MKERLAIWIGAAVYGLAATGALYLVNDSFGVGPNYEHVWLIAITSFVAGYEGARS